MVPHISKINSIYLASLSPLNKIYPVNNSAKMHPIDHISIAFV